MYCPKCSQQQISEEVRFCARCGFKLDEVKILLAEEQNILAAGAAESGLKQARKRDILLGATVMLVGSIAIALLMISTVAGTPLQAVIIPLLLVWAALVAAVLLSGHTAREVLKLFSKDAPASLPKPSSGLTTQVSSSSRQTLPPVQSVPASGLGAWRSNTAELAQPSSITEHTTNSLDSK
ncbi:MAG TPA: zinc ribbon domain-containing protein [Pyrinomonadaceae bacterium]|jgi:hypothetical protein